MKDPDEVVFPSCKDVLVVLRVQESRGRISFTKLDDTPFDLGDSPLIGPSVSEALCTRVTGPTHVVSFSIASSTDWLS